MQGKEEEKKKGKKKKGKQEQYKSLRDYIKCTWNFGCEDVKGIWSSLFVCPDIPGRQKFSSLFYLHAQKIPKKPSFGLHKLCWFVLSISYLLLLCYYTDFCNSIWLK